jgi:putative phosphoesterase
LSKATRIGVIADTHIHHLKEIPSYLVECLKTFDLVIHLGDFVSMEIVDYFKNSHNFYGIAGNHDPQTIKSRLGRSDVIEVNGKRLGLIHGYWFPLFFRYRSLYRFRNEKLDAILYGHTHVIRNEKINNVLFFNPGSACALWPAPWKTYGILKVGEDITGEVVSFDKDKKGVFSKYTDSVVDRGTLIRWACRAPRLPDYSVE